MLKAIIGFRRHTADSGAPAGGGTTGNPASTGSDPGTSNAGAGDTGKAPAPSSSSGDGTTTTTEKTFTQADLDRIVEQRLAEQRTRESKKAADAKKAADEKALADNAQWQTLAEQRAAELEAARTQAAMADAYGKRLNALVDSEIAAWPAEIKALDPGATSLEARLDWLEKSRPLAKKLASLPTAPATEAGVGSTPPAGQQQQAGQQGQQQGTSSTYRFTKPGDVSW